MDSRSTVLIVLFFVLLGTAGYVYWEPISEYAQEQKILDKYPTVRNTINYGLKMVGAPPIEKSINGSNVRTESITKYRRAVVNSLPINSINWVKLFRTAGVNSRVDFSLQTETRDESAPSSLQGSLDLESYKSGQARAKLNLRKTDTHQFKQASIKSVGDTIYVSVPELGLRLQTPSFMTTTSGGIGWGLSRFMSANVNKTETTTWRGRKVHQINLQPSGGGILRLYVSRKKPRYLVGVQSIEGQVNRERQFVYANDAGTRLSEIRNFKNESRVSTVSISEAGDRTELEFSTPESPYLSTLRLSFLEGSGENLSAEVEIESPVTEDPFKLGQVDVGMADGFPDSFRVELSYQGSDSFPVRLSGELASESLNWVEEASEIVVEKAGGSSVGLLKLVGKVIQGNTLKLAEKQGGAGEESSEPQTDESTESDETTGTQQAEDTRKKQEVSRPDTPDRPRSRSESDQGDTQIDQSPAAPEETQTKQSNRRRSSHQGPYPNLTRAPRGSGETLHRSPEYNFPYSEPPKSYKSAQQDYYNGDFESARKKLKKLLQRYPKSVNVNYLLGVIHYELGNADKARGFFEAVFDLRHDPQLRAWSKHYLVQLGDTTAVPAK